ncbi:MAG: HPr family phosphocarrier protein [Rhizobiales bacterium 32-66-8]|nr:MAG: HPr family phosphocarrier protein [Rhizobiales bacterium 32-66-8]
MSQAASLQENRAPSEETVEEAGGGPAAPGSHVRALPVINMRGLHARASAKFVQTVERFTASVTVCRNGEAVDGTSIMGLMMLAAAQGTRITVTAQGPEAEAVLDALDSLLADRFGEGE